MCWIAHHTHKQLGHGSGDHLFDQDFFCFDFCCNFSNIRGLNPQFDSGVFGLVGQPHTFDRKGGCQFLRGGARLIRAADCAVTGNLQPTRRQCLFGRGFGQGVHGFLCPAGTPDRARGR